MDKRFYLDTPVSNIFDIPINAITLLQALDIVDQVIAARETLHIGVVNAAKIVNMRKIPYLGEDVLSSDLILADGASVVAAGRVLQRPLPERVAGIDLMYGILERGSKKGYRVYCLGASEEVSEKVASEVARLYPGVVIAGRRNGYFTADEEKRVAEDIQDAKADVLFVAMTSPKKENFMAKWKSVINVPVIHGVGGSFDVMAGKVERAPVMWQKLGLEWLYRVKQEPRRLWKRYLITNTIFCWMIFKALIATEKKHGG